MTRIMMAASSSLRPQAHRAQSVPWRRDTASCAAGTEHRAGPASRLAAATTEPAAARARSGQCTGRPPRRARAAMPVIRSRRRLGPGVTVAGEL